MEPVRLLLIVFGENLAGSVWSGQGRTACLLSVMQCKQVQLREKSTILGVVIESLIDKSVAVVPDDSGVWDEP